MKYITLIFIFYLSLFACQDVQKEVQNKLQEQVVTKIKNDGPQLGLYSAFYGLVFTNEKKNLIYSDDFYIRRDLAIISYGYSLDDAKIKVKSINKKNILDVCLPLPNQIAVDRRIIPPILETHDNYKVLDEKGKKINIDAFLNEELKKNIKSYENKSIKETKEITKLYFENIANNFGLQLNFKFAPCE